MTKADDDTRVLAGVFRRSLHERRRLDIELPEFLLHALETRVAEANHGAALHERCTLNHYIESELVNLVTLRDMAELEGRLPGFADAVRRWIFEMQESQE